MLWGQQLLHWNQQIQQIKQLVKEIVAEINAESGSLTGPIQGATDGTAAAPGMVGEILQANGNGTIVSTSDTTVYQTVATLTLTPGDWEVFCNYFASFGDSTGEFWLWMGPSSVPVAQTDYTDASASSAWGGGMGTAFEAGDGLGATIGPVEITTATTAGVDLRGQVIGTTTFTAPIQYSLFARRVR